MHLSRRLALAAPAALAALLLAAPASRADVDVQVPLKARSRGTILPEGETETYRFDATAGTAVSYTVAPARGSDLALTVLLKDPADAQVMLAAASAGVKVVVKKLVLASTGSYTLRITAAGTGGYTLSITGLPVKKFADTLSLAASGQAPFPFAAPPGSRVTIAAKAAKGSAAQPRLGMLTGTGYATDLAGQGKITPTSQSVTVAAAGGTGDLSVEVVNGAGAGGDALVSVVVRPPKAKTRKVDVRGETLGRPGGGETVFARAVDAAGGMLVVDQPGSDLDGTALDIPAGALAGPTIITIQSSADIIGVADDTAQASGPSVDLGPSGTAFTGQVTVILPYRLASVPADADPEDLKVVVREDNGSAVTLGPTSVDTVNETVTLNLTGFSICVPVSEPGPPRLGLAPGGDQYWAMLLEFEMQPGGGNDSRARVLRLELGEAALFGDATFQTSLDERIAFWSDAGDGSSLSITSQPEYPAGSFSYLPDGQTVVFDAGGAHSPTMKVTRDGRYMAGRSEDPASLSTHLDFFLRKHRDPITLASLDGTWTFLAEEITLNGGGTGSSLGGKLHRNLGSVTFDGEGGFRGGVAEREFEFDTGNGTWRGSTDSGTGTGSYAIDPDGTIVLTFDPEGGDPGDILRVYPGDGLDVMFGADRDLCDGCVFFFALVRQGSELSTSALAGSFFAADMDVQPSSYSTGPSPAVLDHEYQDEQLALTLSGTGGFQAEQTAHRLRRDNAVAGGVLVENDAESITGTFSVDRKGNMKISVPGASGVPVGAVAPSADFFVLLSPPSSGDDDFLFGLALRPPPPKN